MLMLKVMLLTAQSSAPATDASSLVDDDSTLLVLFSAKRFPN